MKTSSAGLINIRHAVPTDAPKLAEIKNRSWEAAYKDIVTPDFLQKKNERRLSDVENYLNDEYYSQFQYAIECDGVIVGVMTVAPPYDDDTEEDIYDLQAIYLHPDYFRQGIGTIATEFAFDIARNLGKKAMIVWVFTDNHNSIRFYEKCGFSADGKTKILNVSKPRNAIRMKKDL
ncbi:MAG: GNAT family N-acetyltransferase [Oscillospiraceae bacterium]|jgi:RimJ/RimL family protein N-acetyltransferase|nr:GNAT family N-acetyltransferase [Oscillospiraceae bacterium]